MRKNISYSFIATCIFFGRFFLVISVPHNFFYYGQTIDDFLFVLICFSSFFLVMTIVFFLSEKFLKKYYSKIVFVVLCLSAFPLLDYAIISTPFFKPEINPGIKRAIYPVLLMLYVPMVIIVSIKYRLERFNDRIRAIFFVMALLIIYHAIPRSFSIEHINNKLSVASKQPIYILIFDGMSSYEVLNVPEIRPRFPNFNKLAKESFIFSGAHSPGFPTINSVPKILTGIKYSHWREENFRVLISSSDNENFVDLPVNDSIFHLAREHGYNTILLGGAFPYCNLFGGDLTYGEAISMAARMGELLPTPITTLLYVRPLHSRNTTLHLLSEFLSKLDTAPLNTLFFVHFTIPHDPYIFNVDGFSLKYWDHVLKGGVYKREERYMDQLQYVDKRLGEIIDKLKKNQLYDRSLIIVTSDHNVLETDKTKVSLYIKAPFQKEGKLVDGRYNTVNLKRFLSTFFDSGVVDINKLSDSDSQIVNAERK